MKTWIALFRGINMVGRHRLPMKELVALLEGLNARDVKTYRQSGNAVFRHRGKDAARLAGEDQRRDREGIRIRAARDAAGGGATGADYCGQPVSRC